MAEPIQGTHFRNLNDTGQNISNGEVAISHLIAYNTSGATAYIQLFNAAAANVTLGTTRPLFTVALPATTGWKDIQFSPPLRFPTRLSAFSTTTPEGLTGSAAGVFLQVMVN